MRIVCATSLTEGESAFRTLGNVRLVPEREIRRETLREADALVVRSKVRVNAELLDGTPVRFVGTATAGTDHFDTAWMDARGIHWCAAPGCNSNGVAEYVMASLLRFATNYGLSLRGLTIGIVGAGHVGRRVAHQAQALGLRVLLNDPPLQRLDPNPVYRPIAELLDQSDILTLHVPLHDAAPDATRGMVDANFLGRLRPDAILINACRGEVIHEPALLETRKAGRIRHLVLDVFDREPEIDPAIVDCADQISPHIAGYSHQGKLNGTELVYQALCRFSGTAPSWQSPRAEGLPILQADAAAPSDEEVLWSIVRQVYDPLHDDQPLREAVRLNPASRGRRFEELRRDYRVRHEFNQYRVRTAALSPDLRNAVETLGFRLA